MSCQGGKTEVCSILFKNLPSLKEVYGSPVFLSQPEAMTIAGVALADLLDAESSTEMFPVAQMISFLDKGFIWKMTRSGKEFAVGKEFAENIIMALQKAMKNR